MLSTACLQSKQTFNVRLDEFEDIDKVSEDKSEINFIDGPESFKRLVELIRVRREIELLIEVEDNLRLVSYKIGRIEFEPTKNAATNLASRLTKFLAENTGHRWVVSVVSQGGGATLKEEKLITQKEQEMESMRHPLVAAVFEFFPNSKLAFVHNNKMTSSSVKILTIYYPTTI